MRAAVFCLILLAACNGYDDLPLLEVDTIEPPEIEPGATLRIRGQGFPLGKVPRVILRAAVYRPGMAASTVNAELVGTVQSESLIEIPIGDEIFDALGGRSTVDGELRISFRAADERRDVFAAERVRIDFLPDTSTQLRAQGARDETDEPVDAQGFGLELSREELGSAGVRVLSVDPDGLAAIQGVESGDRIVALDGLSVYGRRDFVPDPSKSESIVLVAREGLRGVHALRWPHDATERRVAPFALGLFTLLGLLLGWLSPAVLCLREQHSKVSVPVWLVRLSLLLGFASLLFFVSSLHWVTMWILVLGTFAALFTLAVQRRVGATSFAFAVASTLTVMLLARTASISEIVAAQSPPVFRWFLFQSPASFLAFGAYIYAVGLVSAQPRLSASLYSAAAAVLGAALFLGGWPLAGSAAGIAILSMKATTILLAAHAFALSERVALGLSGLGLALALSGFVVDLGGLFPQWSALAVGGVCALVARALVPPLRRAAQPQLA